MSEEKYNNIFAMLVTNSFSLGDFAGIPTGMMTYRRFAEVRKIITEGVAARWWLSTRLLLGLSHDEALKLGADLRMVQFDNV